MERSSLCAKVIGNAKTPKKKFMKKTKRCCGNHVPKSGCSESVVQEWLVGHNSANLGIPIVDPNDADDQPPGMVESSEDDQTKDATEPDEKEESESDESDTLSTPLRAPSGENKFLECIRRHMKEQNKSNEEVTAADWEQIVKRIQSEVAIEASRSAIAEKVMTSSASSPHTTHPFGSVSAWLANADDDSQRRKSHDHEATGHSSKSKPTELTTVDMIGGPDLSGTWEQKSSSGSNTVETHQWPWWNQQCW